MQTNRTTMIKIFGHLAPDTDATCSAVIWAWYLNDVRKKPAQAFVLGEPNSEALFVLKRWGMDVPALLGDLGGAAEVVDVGMGEDDRCYGFVTQVLPGKCDGGTGGLFGGQRIHDDPACFSFDNTHIGKVEAAQLVDALGDFE